MKFNNRFLWLGISIISSWLLVLTLQLPSIPGSAEMDVQAAPSATQPNIIFIIVDTLRPDHISSYGYGRPTTPNLDTLVAAQGVRFVDAAVSSPWTFPSNAALFSGQTPTALGLTQFTNSSHVSEDTVMLAEHLQGAGYYTAGFVASYFAGAQYGFGQGFDIFQENMGSGANRTRAEQLNTDIQTWLDTIWLPSGNTQPLFLLMYYMDPHTWYNAPAPYDTMYDATYTGTLSAEVYQDGQIVVSGQYTPTARDVYHLKALYDGEITYWDYHFGQMMAHLDSAGLLNNSIIIVTSDHGEFFGEHDYWTHRNALYEEVIRVPFLVRYPGIVPSNLVVTSPVQTYDITPTLLDWLSIPIPGNLQAQSIRALAEGGTAPGSRNIYSELEAVTDPNTLGYWLAARHPWRAVRQDDWKYIHHVQLVGQDELYQLQPASLYETQNVIGQEPGIADAMLQSLIDWYHVPTIHQYVPVFNRLEE